jgi:hypothetical protein
LIASFRSPANQVAQVSLVSGDATDHEDSVLSVDVDDVDAAYALARATGLLPDYDKCQAYIANVHSAFDQEADRPTGRRRADVPPTRHRARGPTARARARGDG